MGACAGLRAAKGPSRSQHGSEKIRESNLEGETVRPCDTTVLR